MTSNMASCALKRRPWFYFVLLLVNAVVVVALIAAIKPGTETAVSSASTWLSSKLGFFGCHQAVADQEELTSYGKKKRPLIGKLTLMSNVPRDVVPTAHNHRRLIVIGDIHGMNDELGKLLEIAEFDATRDHVVTLGDMVNKGPDSRGVVARLMALNASAVRGNHEDHLLIAWKKHQSRSIQDNDDDPLLETEGRRRRKRLLKVAKSLKPEQIQWLAELPVILKGDPLPLYFVHGGLVPGLKLAKQDPWAVMNMRTLVYPEDELRRRDDSRDDESESAVEDMFDNEYEDLFDEDHPIPIPVDDHSGEKWYKAWDRFQKHIKKSTRRTVLYGHDAKRGFTEGKYTVGLDSGCVAGGHLTGLIVEVKKQRKKGSRDFTYRKVEVPCKNRMQ